MLSVFLYWRYRWWCFQYLHTGDTDGDSSVSTYWICGWWWFRWWLEPLSRVKFEHFWDKLGVVRKYLPWKGEYWCCSGIVSSLGTFPKVIQRSRSSRMKRDCIILGHMSRSDPETSVFENEEGLYHPGTYVQKWSGDLSHRECSRIVSSLNFGLEQIQWIWYSRMCVDSIIPRGRILWVPQMCWSYNSERKDR